MHLFLYRNLDDDGEYGIVRAADRFAAAELLRPRFLTVYEDTPQRVEFISHDEVEGPAVFENTGGATGPEWPQAFVNPDDSLCACGACDGKGERYNLARGPVTCDDCMGSGLEEADPIEEDDDEVDD